MCALFHQHARQDITLYPKRILSFRATFLLVESSTKHLARFPFTQGNNTNIHQTN